MSKQLSEAPIFDALANALKYRLLLYALFLIQLPAQSQVHLNARTLTTSQGLSDNRITCIFKDSKGFVWVGTQNGLNRFDGKRIIVYKPGTGNSISNEVINDVAEDSRGNIWVATMNGLNTLNPVKDEWSVMLPLAHNSDADIPSNLVWDIAIDKLDRVWIASDVQEFCCYDIRSKQFTYFNWPDFVKSVPQFSYSSYNSIKRFVFKNSNELVLASNKSLVLLNISRKKFSYLGGEYRSDVWDLYYDSTTQISYASIEAGRLVAYQHTTGKTLITRPGKESYPSTSFNTNLLQSKWLAAQNGYFSIHPGGAITLNNNIPELSTSLLPGSVAAVLQADGINWVGGFNGVSYYDTRFPTQTFLPLVPASDKSGWNEMGGVLLHKGLNSYFVCAADSAAVFIINRESGFIKKITRDANGRRFRHCNTVKLDKQNNVWLLTDNAVFRYDEISQSFRHFPTPNHGEDVVFRHVVQDAEGNYWFASFHRGVYYYNNQEQSFLPLPAANFTNVLTGTSLLADDVNRCVWIGTYSIGFYRYNLESKTLTSFRETDKNPAFAALNLVNDITQDNTGAIWVATQAGGLFRFEVESGGNVDVQQFNMQTGLTENSFAAVFASESTLWTLNGNGISSFKIENKKLLPRTKLQSNFSSFVSDVRYPHHIWYDAHQQQLLSAVGGGLLSVAEAGRGNSMHLPLTITTTFLNNHPVESLSSKLAPAENNLKFQFSNLYYGSSLAGLKTYYKLEGWNKHWVLSNTNFEAEYQNLPAGDYRFYVATLSANRNLAGVVASKKFTVTAPFYKHWLFTLLIISLSFLVIYMLFRRRVNQVRKKAAVAQQLTELEAKALRAQMNPHFIFNCLNAIQELIVTENIEAAYNYLAKFSKLLRLVLNHSEQPLITIEEEITVLQLYLELESLRFRKSFDYKIDVDTNVDTESTLVPPLLLQPYIENAIWHGLMLKEGDKVLSLRMRREKDLLILEVEDNGIGRAKSADIKRQQLGSEQFASKGLKLSKQRLNLMEADGRKGTVVIEDLTCDGGPCGTKVTITLPIILT